jgi:hypothetical protein
VRDRANKTRDCTTETRDRANKMRYRANKTRDGKEFARSRKLNARSRKQNARSHDAGLSTLQCQGGPRIYSAYVFGLAYKPFQTGVFGDKKFRLMEIFLQTHDSESPRFLKYCALIARDLDLPCGTPDERQHIFDMLATLPGFSNRMTYPKMGNWFAWNKSVYEQNREFWVSRMVYEDSHGIEDSYLQDF